MPFPRHVLPAALAVVVLAAAPVLAQSAADGERLFKEKCTACHTIGGGKLVGPDLKDVTARRERAWLLRQIKDPLGLVQAGDPIATQLVKDMNGMVMAPLGLDDAQVESVAAFLAASTEGPVADVGVPWQYLPTLGIGALVALGLTVAALGAGRKHVDVR